MALNHITLDQTKALAQQAKLCRNRWSQALADLRDLRGTLNEYINGDGSQDTHYAAMVTGGFGATNTESHTGWAQVDNLLTAINTNASQASVMDKVNQFINFLGGN